MSVPGSPLRPARPLHRRLLGVVARRVGLAGVIGRIGRARADRLWRGRWESAVRSSRVNLHPSVEFTGERPTPERVAFGMDVQIERDTTIWLDDGPGARGRLVFGDRSYVGRNSYIGVHEAVTVGRNVMIGAYSYVISGNHVYARRDVPIRDQGFCGSPVTVGDDAWIGTHVVILPGVTVGPGSVIGAGSVVTRDVPPYEVWVGSPARFLKSRP